MNRIASAMMVLILAASLTAGETIEVMKLPNYGWGSGGEYTLTYGGQSYQSFCLELSETVSPPRTYDAVWNDEALRGGTNWGPTGGDGGDLLSPKTAYLYTQFLAGTLDGYDYTPGWGRGQSAWALQNVIWAIEDERLAVWAPASLQAKWYSDAMACDWKTTGNVGVWNLYENGRYRQDMLGVATVPVPGAVVLCGLGASILGWTRRKMYNR